MKLIKIRFNTKYLEAADTSLKWRLLVDDQELLASHVELQVPAETSEDVIASGETKWHFRCQGVLHWQGTRATIRAV